MILVSQGTLRHVLRAACKDTTRLRLCGVQFERRGEITYAVATDGHRLTVIAYNELGMADAPLSSVPLPDEDVFVPLWLFDAAKAAFDPEPAALWVSNSLVQPFDTDAKVRDGRAFLEVLAKTDPKYAPGTSWRQVIPGTFPAGTAAINHKLCRAALKSSTGESVRFGFKGGNVYVGDCPVGTCPPLSLVLHLERRYTEDAVKTMTGNFTLDVDASLDPVLFSDQCGARVVVMPRRS